MPAIDNMVAIANCYNMTVGEILEDEAYRIFEKKADARKRTIEVLEVAGRIETFIGLKSNNTTCYAGVFPMSFSFKK